MNGQANKGAAAQAGQVEVVTDKPQGQAGTLAGGLTKEEAQRRLTQYGYNELPEKKRNPLLEFRLYRLFRGIFYWLG